MAFSLRHIQPDVSKKMATLFDLPESPECRELLSFGVHASFERRSFGIQVMLPSNTRLAEVEAVTIFKGVHVVAHVMRDVRLQFADKPLKHTHLGNGHEPGMFQSPAVPCDGREAAVKVVQTLVRLQLSSKMVRSHCSSNQGMVVRSASVLPASAHSV